MKSKKEYVESIHDQLARWQAELDSLKQKAETVETDLKEIFHSKIQVVEEKVHMAELRAHELEDIGHDGWEEMKQAYEEIRKELEYHIAHAQLPPH